MRILGTTSNGRVQLHRNQHTGQDSTGTDPSRQVPRARFTLRDTQSWKLKERRKLRQINAVHQAELAYLQSIEVDANLLTGNLDQDISILDIVA